MAARASVGLKLVELLVEVGSGEPLTERVEDVIGGLARPVQPVQFAAESRLPSSSVGTSGPARGERRRIVDRDVACRVDNAGAEPDGGPMPLPDAPHAHHESQAASGGFATGRDGRPCWGCTTPRPRSRTRW